MSISTLKYVEMKTSHFTTNFNLTYSVFLCLRRTTEGIFIYILYPPLIKYSWLYIFSIAILIAIAIQNGGVSSGAN